MKRQLKRFVSQAVMTPLLRFAVVRRVCGFIYLTAVYNEVRADFIRRGDNSRWSREVRAKIVRRFELIDRRLRLLTSPTEGLFLAEAVLSLDAAGPLVECGCYNGGSTAKLSILASLTGRELLVFDSFEGLPGSSGETEYEYHARWGSRLIVEWQKGLYRIDLEKVRFNVETLGEISVSSFYKGWFSETLTDDNLPERIAFAFTDVDLPQSARDCIEALWPRLADGGVYFSHDFAFIRVLQRLFEDDLWTGSFKEFPPIPFGCGYGLGDAAQHLGFLVKGRDLSPDYLASLTPSWSVGR